MYILHHPGGWTRPQGEQHCLNPGNRDQGHFYYCDFVQGQLLPVVQGLFGEPDLSVCATPVLADDPLSISRKRVSSFSK